MAPYCAHAQGLADLRCHPTALPAAHLRRTMIPIRYTLMTDDKNAAQ
jgi:hypothetical protein